MKRKYCLLLTIVAVMGLCSPALHSQVPQGVITLQTNLPTGSQFMIEVTTTEPITVNWGENDELYTVERITQDGGIVSTIKSETITLKGTTGIQELYLSSLGLTRMSITSAPNMTLLSATGNELTAISGLETLPALVDLNLSRNKFSELPSGLKLKQLRINTNLLTNTASIKQMTDLEYLDCSYNNIATLDLTNLSKLTDLVAKSSKVQTCNLSGCVAIQTITLDKNLITALDLSMAGQLKKLMAADNKLSTLAMPKSGNLIFVDLTPNALDDCQLNLLFTALPTLAEAPLGKNLFIKNNPGTITSKTSLATEKNWITDATGNGSGCKGSIADLQDSGIGLTFMGAGKFQFQAGAQQLVIYNLVGQVVAYLDLSLSQTTATVDLPQGEYIAILYRTNGQTVTRKYTHL